MKNKTLLKVLFVIAFLFTFLPSQQTAYAATAFVQGSYIAPIEPLLTAVSYDRDAAVDWALKNNYNDHHAHNRSCMSYVSLALKAGGIPGMDGRADLVCPYDYPDGTTITQVQISEDSTLTEWKAWSSRYTWADPPTPAPSVVFLPHIKH